MRLGTREAHDALGVAPERDIETLPAKRHVAQFEDIALVGIPQSYGVITVGHTLNVKATVGVALAGMDINIFVQIGFVVLVGLAAKHAILIVEFAKEKSANPSYLFHNTHHTPGRRFAKQKNFRNSGPVFRADCNL